jgi:hypothetical protein
MREQRGRFDPLSTIISYSAAYAGAIIRALLWPVTPPVLSKKKKTLKEFQKGKNLKNKNLKMCINNRRRVHTGTPSHPSQT